MQMSGWVFLLLRYVHCMNVEDMDKKHVNSLVLKDWCNIVRKRIMLHDHICTALYASQLLGIHVLKKGKIDVLDDGTLKWKQDDTKMQMRCHSFCLHSCFSVHTGPTRWGISTVEVLRCGRVVFTYTACTYSNNRNAHSECLHQQRDELQVQMAPSLHAGSSVCAAIWVRVLV